MAKKKGKGGLIIGIVLGVLVLGGGGFAAMAAMGKIPFLAKRAKTPPTTYGEGKEPPKGAVASTAPAPDTKKPDSSSESKPDEQKDSKAKKPAPAPAPDPLKGAKKIAAVWNNMETADLIKVVKAYPQTDLPLVMTRLEAEKAAEVLAGLDPATAAKLSTEMAKIAGAPVKAE